MLTTLQVSKYRVILETRRLETRTIREIPAPSTHFLVEQTLDNLQYELKDHDYLILLNSENCNAANIPLFKSKLRTFLLN